MIRVIIVVCMFVITGVNLAVAEEITIAAASDLNFAFREIVTEYEKTTGNHVRLTLGSSGNFFTQISAKTADIDDDKHLFQDVKILFNNQF